MNATLAYEVKARVFFEMTGLMAPGKDAPQAGLFSDEDMRKDRWVEWNQDCGRAIDLAIKALSAYLDSENDYE